METICPKEYKFEHCHFMQPVPNLRILRTTKDGYFSDQLQQAFACENPLCNHFEWRDVEIEESGDDLVAEWQEPEPGFVDVPLKKIGVGGQCIRYMIETPSLGYTDGHIDYYQAVACEGFMGFVYHGFEQSGLLLHPVSTNGKGEIVRPVAVRFRK